MALSGVRLETSGKEIGSFNHIKPRNSATDKRGTCLRPGPSLWHGKIRLARARANAGRTARRRVVFFFIDNSTQRGAALASLAVRFWMIGNVLAHNPSFPTLGCEIVRVVFHRDFLFVGFDLMY